MELRLIIAGIGGQGVVFATKVLSHAALARGEAVLASESHGMSQRGGSVMSHLKVGGSAAALIRRGTADALIAFDRDEALRNLTYLRPGGSAIVNSADGLAAPVLACLAALDIGVFSVDASACAEALGAPAAANLVVLGFAAGHGRIGFSPQELKQAARELSPARAVDTNWRALDAGAGRAGAKRDGQPTDSGLQL